MKYTNIQSRFYIGNISRRQILNVNLSAPGMDPSMGQERRTPVTPSSSSRYHRRRSSGSRDERYRSGKSLNPPFPIWFCLDRISSLLFVYLIKTDWGEVVVHFQPKTPAETAVSRYVNIYTASSYSDEDELCCQNSRTWLKKKKKP